MRKWNILFAMVLVLLAVGMTISAQDDGTTDDNWCLEGGPWENACGTDARGEWLWTCGWYFAQAQLGNIHWAPWWCATQMPAGCYLGVGDVMDYSGDPNQAENADLADACGGAVWGQFWGIVFALDQGTADEFCAEIADSYVGTPWEGVSLDAEPAIDWGFDLGPDGYLCIG